MIIEQNTEQNKLDKVRESSMNISLKIIMITKELLKWKIRMKVTNRKGERERDTICERREEFRSKVSMRLKTECVVFYIIWMMNDLWVTGYSR
jgi:hypothetical protein